MKSRILFAMTAACVGAVQLNATCPSSAPGAPVRPAMPSGKVVMGSVAHSVLVHAHCSVMVVRQPHATH